MIEAGSITPPDGTRRSLKPRTAGRSPGVNGNRTPKKAIKCMRPFARFVPKVSYRDRLTKRGYFLGLFRGRWRKIEPCLRADLLGFFVRC
jgi:hypothetical protein